MINNTAQDNNNTTDNTSAIKIAYFDPSAGDHDSITYFRSITDGACLIIGYVPTQADLQTIGDKIRALLDPVVKFFLITTDAVIISDNSQDAPLNPFVITLQIFTNRLINDCQILSLPLPSEDIKRGKIFISMEEKIGVLHAALSNLAINLTVDPADTLALSFMDLMSNSEAAAIQAVYSSQRLPCLLIGGSITAKVGVETPNIYDGYMARQNHWLLCLIKIQPSYRFAVFKTHAYEPTNLSYTVGDINAASRYVTKIVDDNGQYHSFIDTLKKDLQCDSAATLQTKIDEDYSFGIEIYDDAFLRTMRKIDEKNDRIYFYADIGVGEKVRLFKKLNMLQSFKQDWEIFMLNKPQPCAALIIDCHRRCRQPGAQLDYGKLIPDCVVGGLASYGELLGIPANNTLLGLFFFESDGDNAIRSRYKDDFIIYYSEFKSYFILRHLKQIKSTGNLEKKILTIFNEFSNVYLAEHGDLTAVGDSADYERQSPSPLHNDARVNHALEHSPISNKRLQYDNSVATLISYIQILLTRLAVQREDLEEKLQTVQRSIHKYTLDELTNTYTRRSGYEFINELLENRPADIDFITFSIIDLNNLKMANDHGGHKEGDYYLTLTVEFIRAHLQPCDFICRYGGDEFIIVFPNSRPAYVEQFLKRINRQLQAFGESKRKNYNMSFAFGVERYDFSSKRSFDDIFKSIDQKMYRNKLRLKKILKDRPTT